MWQQNMTKRSNINEIMGTFFSPKKTLVQVQSEGDQAEKREGTKNLVVRMRSKMRNLYIRVGNGEGCSVVDSLEFKKQYYIIVIIIIIRRENNSRSQHLEVYISV